ncbi:DUF58 domain-containing protein [Pseudarthrobacter niigatensis]|uniref:Uncharacterized protein (DUF58 family) n=1 Tax=Pseudarthrobacter niigatensis TaxID=369935 RepID=A0AAJ1SNM7_9MICC|nr:DUF58 domain-containing protein [Pseudarthrobacter niigatensis]MDQ0144206.1 uncharacterized protein (DUF58 family) [Pseudarthrobacter niigatensis]MDQ0266466.1 uncharacterized protein (DUF58 family) [Pseudarthrobacter niigatensis]
MATLLQRVKSKIAIFAHRKARGMLDGEYGSVFRGRSLDFDDLRAYVPGDEVRDIDWKASARHGSPLIRRYVAVRRQTVLLVTDTGRNMAAEARSGEAKKDIAVLSLGVLGYLALRHGDVVGMVCGDSAATRSFPAKGGEAHLERLLRHVDSHTGLDAPGSSIRDQLDYIARNISGRHLLFVVADELAADDATGCLLRRLRAQHEILWLTVRDAELVPPPLADARLHRSGDSYSVADSSLLARQPATSSVVAAAYAAATKDRDAARKAMLQSAGITEGEVAGSGDVIAGLFALLERHRRAG